MSTGSGHTAVVGVADPFQHEALFYRDPAEYLAVTVPFIEAGLARDEPVLVAVPRPNLDLLRSAVGEAAGGITYADMSWAGRNPGRIIPYVLHAFITRHAARHTRIIGEPIWDGRSPDEYPACVQHEALINLAFAGRDAAIVCPYDAAALRPDVLADAQRTHPVLADAANRWTSRSYTEPGALVAAFNQPLDPAPAGAATLAFNATGLRAVRQMVGGVAGAAGLSAAQVGRLQLAVNEIATNAVTHGGGTGSLSVWVAAGHVVAEIVAQGGLHDPLAGRVPVSPRQPNGRGLLLVNEVCDLVRVHTSGQAITTRLYSAVSPGS